MLLTLKQPAHHGFRSFHDYSPPTPPSTSRYSPVAASNGSSLPPLSAPRRSSSLQPMSTPHRGLPPPAAMTLPQPSQGPPPLREIREPPVLSQPMGQLPAPPQQWQGAEESMRNWLHAKAEEDKRKQEEEKTRQETLRLEQRKIEQEMLRTSLSGGIPPYLIPMVFAGMGGGNLPNASLEWAQHYMAQAHHLQQQQQQLQQQQQQQQQQQLLTSTGPDSPENRRESRLMSHPYAAVQQPVPAPLPSTPIGPPGSQQSVFAPSYQMSPAERSRQSSHAAPTRPPQTTHLPRLNTGEMHPQPPPLVPSGVQLLPGQPAHPLQHSQSASQAAQEQHSSPSIYFHHWQPPTTQSTSTSSVNQPTTPSDQTSSPKKRKAQGPQQAAPPPTSQPQYTSPPFSQAGSSNSGTPSGRRRAHSRQQSDYSSRGTDNYGRPMSRHRHTESGISNQSGVSPTQQTGPSMPASAADEAGRRDTSQRMQSSEHADRMRERPYSAGSGSEMRREEHRPSEREGARRSQ